MQRLPVAEVKPQCDEIERLRLRNLRQAEHTRIKRPGLCQIGDQYRTMVNGLAANTTHRELHKAAAGTPMSLLRLKTIEARVGVVGLYNSGKTVLLTSLINHLQDHDPDRFPLGSKDTRV